MPLVLPILRTFWVFTIVLESFKTLKPPPPSAKYGGQPTPRAMSQRKRGMKGCMTIWLVWCSYTAYERTLDGIVGLFIPFYSEIKSLVIIFFLITRARGAEPIYLHVLRPLIKPYVATLDALLDVIHSIGDFFLLLASIPADFVMSFYRPPEDADPPSHHEAQTHHNIYPTVSSTASIGRNSRAGSQGVSNGAPSVGEPTETIHGTVRTRRKPLETAHARATSEHAPIPIAPSSSGTGQQAQASGDTQHVVWTPPQAVFDEEIPTNLPDSGVGPPTPARAEEHDWRKYEPFPSAYPATPPSAYSALPSLSEAMAGMSRAPLVDEPADWRTYEAFPSAYPASPLGQPNVLPRHSIRDQLNTVSEEPVVSEISNGSLQDGHQGFRGSLEPPREITNSNSAGDLSDDHEEERGVYCDEDTLAEEEEAIDGAYGDDEDDEEEEEDDFDATLRTPPMLSRYDNFSRASSTMTDDSTGLTTTDPGSPLFARTNSAASTVLNGSDSSLTSRKGPLPDETVRTRSARNQRITKPSNKPNVKRDGPRSQLQAPIYRPPIERHPSSTTLDETEPDANEADSLKTKKSSSIRSGVGLRQQPSLHTRSASDRVINEPRVPATRTRSSTASSTNTVRSSVVRHSRGPASQPSIKLAKKPGMNAAQPGSEGSAGDVPTVRKNSTVASNGSTKS